MKRPCQFGIFVSINVKLHCDSDYIVILAYCSLLPGITVGNITCRNKVLCAWTFEKGLLIRISKIGYATYFGLFHIV